MTTTTSTPSLVLTDEELMLRHERAALWRTPLCAIRLVGECTNEDGPFAEDWFAVFATSEGEWLFAELTPANSDVIRGELACRLGQPIEFGLCSSATFASRIILPAEYSGRPLFRFTCDRKPTLAGRVLGLFGIEDVHLRLTDDATVSPRARCELARWKHDLWSLD
jgi:hypothetical protein